MALFLLFAVVEKVYLKDVAVTEGAVNTVEKELKFVDKILNIPHKIGLTKLKIH